MTAERTGDGPRPLNSTIRIAYGAGSLSHGLAYSGLAGGVLTIFLNQVLGLSPLLVGSVIMISLIADGVADPLIGRFSDRLGSRLGRRHPFMYASALPAAALFALLWNLPQGLSRGALLALSFVAMAGVRIAVSLYEIPSNALTAELTPDYDQRTLLQAHRWFFGVIGGALGSLTLQELFVGSHGVLYRQGYARWGLAASVVIFAFIVVSALGTQSRVRDLPPRPTPPRQSLGQAVREIRTTFANRSLMALMLAGLFSGVAQGVIIGLSIYIYNHFWDLSPRQYGVLIPLHSVGSLMAVFLAPRLARQFGKKATMISLFIGAVTMQAGPLFLRLIGLMPPNGSPWIMPILGLDGFLTSTLGVMGYIIAGSMVADIVEDAAVKSGARSEGLLYAAYGLLPKFTGGVGAFLTGVLLHIVHFPAHAARGTVDPMSMRHLVMIFLPATVLLNLCSISALGLYRIDRRTHEANLATLAQAAATAEAMHGVEAVEAGDTVAPAVGAA
ncbi:MAG TPA: MFS transporter [Caulobacteraceae bacterium]|jgi:Na+/melibiose symporter-like transporter|nr:MFS transporter [Caulobacteraceae bacterium]